MSINNLLAAAFIAVGFVGWPILGSYAKTSGNWMSFLVLAGSMIAVLPLSWRQMATEGLPSTRSVLILLGAAVINGVAVWVYSMKAADKSIPTAVFITLVSVLMVVAAPILDWAIKRTHPSNYQLAGFALAPVVIFLLTKK